MICGAKVEPAVSDFPPLRWAQSPFCDFVNGANRTSYPFSPILGVWGLVDELAIEETIDGFFDFITWWGLTLHSI
jgi:hypothetical protein